MMKWIILIEVILTASCFLLAWWTERVGGRGDEYSELILVLVGLIAAVVTVMTALGWGIYALVHG